MANEIMEAKKVIREAFERDPDLKESYVANLAVILMDELGIPYKRWNEIATKILDRIFG